MPYASDMFRLRGLSSLRPALEIAPWSRLGDICEKFHGAMPVPCKTTAASAKVTVNVAKCLAAVKPAQRPLVANGAAHCLAGTARPLRAFCAAPIEAP